MLIAWFSYRRYYPPLRSVMCDVPYDKADLAGPDGFSKLDDEEAVARPFIPRSGTSSEGVYQLQDIEPSRST
jgi:diacylglycerol diphosphate phosphatase/phosphatidate phosphatase